MTSRRTVVAQSSAWTPIHSRPVPAFQPARSASTHGPEILSYELKNENVGGMEFKVPLVGGGFKLAGSGSYCHAIVRVVDGKVAEVNYTGDNDDFVGKEGVCAPIVRGCLRAHGKDPEVRTANKGR